MSRATGPKKGTRGRSGPAEPAGASDRDGSGTILIPAGETRLPDAMRPADESEPEAPDDDADGVESSDHDAGPPQFGDSHPNMEAALAAVRSRYSSLPPGHPSYPGTLRAPSYPPVNAGVTLDPDQRREAIESRRSRTRIVVLIVLVLLAAGLAVATALIVSQQRSEAARERVEQILTAHRIALDTVQDANTPIVAELGRLGTVERPDFGGLANVARDAEGLFDGLVVPAPEGEFVGLGRNLANAIDAERALLDRVSEFASVQLADANQSDVDQLLRAWDTAETALRAAYADQPALEVPNFAETTDVFATFAGHVTRAGDAERQRLAVLGEVDAYVTQVNGILDELERVRADFVIRDRTITTSSELSAAIDVVNSGVEGRWELADRMDAMNVPSDFVDVHTALSNALRDLGDVVSGLASAVYEADCYGYGYYDYWGYYHEPTCPTVGDTFAYEEFVSASDAAGDRFDSAKAALMARYAQVVETLQ